MSTRNWWSPVRSAGVAVLSLLAAVSVQAGTTYYVDCNRPDNTGDGLTPETAKKSIQAAVDAAAANGMADDTVIVLPGVYESDPEAPVYADGSSGLKTVVRLTERITLKARDGRDGAEATEIVGRLGSGAYGCGEEAIRGITIASGVKGVIVEGFTIRDCATRESGGAIQKDGGALYSADGSDNYLCYCKVSNCHANVGGALYCGTAIGCLFTHNQDADAQAAVGYYSDFAYCVFARNVNVTYLLTDANFVVNCTFADNRGGIRTPLHMYTFVGNCLMINTQRCGFTAMGGNIPGGKYGAGSNNVCTASGTYDIKGNMIENASIYTLMAPALGDFRAVANSDAVAYGEYKYLSEYLSKLPEAYRYRDYNGQPIVADANGKINCGAIQELAPEPSGARLKIHWRVGTALGLNPREEYSIAQFEKWPTQVRLDNGGDDTLLYFYDNANKICHQPLPDGHAWMTVPPSGDVTVSAVFAKEVFYADASKEDDSGDGLKPGTAKKTIQAAVDCATQNYALVRVAPGVYDEGGAEAHGLMSRVAITNFTVYVRSTEGPEKTVIMGAADPSTGGYGTGATRCVTLTKDGQVQGFTLTGGYTATATDEQHSSENCMYAGGVHFPGAGNASSCTVADCIITNNHAKLYSAVHYGLVLRSFIADNHQSGNGQRQVARAALSSCIVRRCDGKVAEIGTASYLYGCTVDGADDSDGLLEANTSCYDTILLNGGTHRLYKPTYEFFGNLLWQTSFTPSYTFDNTPIAEGDYSYVKLDPVMPSTATGDYRPWRLSGAIGAGDTLDRGTAWKWLDSDIDGNPAVYGADGRVTPGAVQTFCEVVYVTNVLGKVTITGGRIGLNALNDDTHIVLTATEADVRPFLGFRIDGQLTDRSVTTLVIDASYAGKTVEAVYTTDWYVDATNGDDEKDGKTPVTARKTFEYAMKLPFRSGDTLHALPGVYDRGQMMLTNLWYGGDKVVSLPCRLVINQDISVVADEGPEKTVIKGAAASDASRPYGLGPGAMRCVGNSRGSWLRGFTLTDGHTLAPEDVPGYESTADDDMMGAAYLSTIGGGSGKLSDCILSNNFAAAATCAGNAALYRCRMVGNLAANGPGVVARVSFLYGCYADHNVGKEPFSSYRALHGCTVGPDHLGLSGEPDGKSNPNDDGVQIINSVVLLPLLHSSARSKLTVDYSAHNSILLASSGYKADVATNCTFIAQAEDACLDETGAAIPGSGSPALGAANAEKYDWLAKLGGADVYGNPRVSNNGVDLGAVQSVWTGRYARIIGGRSMTCCAVSSNAFEVARGVNLNGGAIDLVVSDVPAGGDRLHLVWTVADGAQLRVLVNGEEVRTYSTSGEDFIDVGAGATSVRFEGLGSGEAVVCRCRADRGMLMIVR